MPTFYHCIALLKSAKAAATGQPQIEYQLVCFPNTQELSNIKPIRWRHYATWIV